MAQRAIGVDLGGTDVKAGVVDNTGRLLSKVTLPTEAEKGHKAILANVARAADLAREEGGVAWRKIAALGLGAPGVFVPPRGIARHVPNLPALKGRELLRPVLRRLGVEDLPASLDNDANMAAYAEDWIGAGKETNTTVLVTLGTGIGGGIILDGEVWRGPGGAAGEPGHMVLFPDGIRCGCGSFGCFEMYASASALVRRFHEAVEAGARGRPAARARKGEEITARAISDAAKEGDRLCRRLLEETGRYLGICAANLLNTLNAERIVFAGGLTGAGALLLEAIRAEAAKRTIPVAMKGVKILFSRLGNDAGLLGAAGYALGRARKPRRK
jgi:glucokinase